MIPAEWAPHRATWLAWPYRDDEWTDLSAAQNEIRAFIEAIASTERVDLLVHPSIVEPPTFSGNVSIHRIAYGDAWTRDTFPIFTSDGRAIVFGFDGWGGKYRMPGDEDLSARIAAHCGLDAVASDLVLEGGALEFDGAGNVLTTRACVALRNPSKGDAAFKDLARVLQCEVWAIDGTLQNDHTDGHIDTLARFVEPGRVLCMHGRTGDPNRDAMRSIAKQLARLGLHVDLVPSPGEVRTADGTLLPASYCNYYLANDLLLVPTYGVPNDAEAVETNGSLFPGRRPQGIPSRAILESRVALHCITQLHPA